MTAVVNQHAFRAGEEHSPPSDAVDGVRNVQLELLAVLDEWCREHDVPYAVTHGTALGAVRHAGFIPWDDDIDLAMPREAFDRFVASAPRDLDGRYFVQHSTTDEMFALSMAKLRRNDSLFVEDETAAVPIHHGIFIDIFPLDRRPASSVLQRVHGGSVRFLSRLCRIRSGYLLRPSSGSGLLLAHVAARILRVVPPRLLTSARDRVLVSARRGQGSLTIAAGPYGYDREHYSLSWLESVVRVPFEGLSVPVFAAVDEYLKELYGNYWKLPPLHERVSPHPVARIELPTDPPDGSTGYGDA